MAELSFNEIELGMRKACSVLGCDYGVAEEFGRAAVWLVRHSRISLEPLLELSETAPVLPDIRNMEFGWETDHPLALACISAFDLVAAMPGRRFRFRRWKGGIESAVALAGAASLSYGTGFRFRTSRFLLTVGATGFDGKIPDPGAETRLDIEAGPDQVSCPIPKQERGSVPDNVWERICRLAEQTYVPASEMSRQLGAGAESG
ncbi:MAG: DUF3726 domain-containing protein [Rhodobacteraceae bacterium]|nr:DUF3726 domain-containing protein [Paracoccaceae bacterium]